MFKVLLSLLVMTTAIASSNDVEKIISSNPLIMDDFSYVNTLSIKRKVKIAIIGDYVHPEEFESIKPNYDEIENNGIDDDGNGYADDFYGLDAHYGNGHLQNPILTGHENGIVSILDAIISNYNLMDNIEIIPINIYSYDGRFDDFRFKKMADSIDYAVTRGAEVISISQGISKYNKYSFLFVDNNYDKSLAYIQSAVDRAKKKGVIVVGSVSNDSTRDHFDEPSIPGNLENVLSVANVNFDGVIKSGYGKNIDIAYYGTDIFVWDGRCEEYVRTNRESCERAQLDNGFATVTGSSFSTPIVALSLAIAKSTGASIEMNNDMRNKIQNSCSKEITTRKNISSRCIFSPSKFTSKYIR